MADDEEAIERQIRLEDDVYDRGRELHAWVGDVFDPEHEFDTDAKADFLHENIVTQYLSMI